MDIRRITGFLVGPKNQNTWAVRVKDPAHPNIDGNKYPIQNVRMGFEPKTPMDVSFLLDEEASVAIDVTRTSEQKETEESTSFVIIARRFQDSYIFSAESSSATSLNQAKKNTDLSKYEDQGGFSHGPEVVSLVSDFPRFVEDKEFFELFNSLIRAGSGYDHSFCGVAEILIAEAFKRGYEFGLSKKASKR